MSGLTFVKPEKVWLKNHPELNEKWVQDQIAGDPRILVTQNGPDTDPVRRP